MKITGITAEYNPLHNGHLYHLEQTREASGCDAIAVAMSGDYVQRGEAAIIDKWKRARLALENGADLVVEIPTLFCLGNAFQYASASVRMLEALGCDTIAFGSESGDTELIMKVAGVLRERHDEIAEGIASLVKEGKSYPAARTEVYRNVRSGDLDEGEIERELAVMSDPNDILALEYIMNMQEASPLVIKRTGAGHNDAGSPGVAFQSASAIRYMLKTGADVGMHVPEGVSEALSGSALSFSERWSGLLRYAALSRSPAAIEDCPSAGEGLGNLLRASVKENEAWDDIIKAVKSKRYTYTRISRLCMQLILGITRSEYPMTEPLYIRVLGFSESGREALSEVKKSGRAKLPLITNINKEAEDLDREAVKLLGLDIHAAEIYDLVTKNDIVSCSDHKMMPVIV